LGVSVATVVWGDSEAISLAFRLYETFIPPIQDPALVRALELV
jgi:hypothetical protein